MESVTRASRSQLKRLPDLKYWNVGHQTVVKLQFPKLSGTVLRFMCHYALWRIREMLPPDSCVAISCFAS